MQTVRHNKRLAVVFLTFMFVRAREKKTSGKTSEWKRRNGMGKKDLTTEKSTAKKQKNKDDKKA